ncbi:reverse transcriptase domain-containing protein [Tanacetum coccineum]
MIGSDLTEKTRGKLCNLLQRSLDIFAWTPTDMTGVPRHIEEHRLNVQKGCQPVRQKKRGQAAERRKKHSMIKRRKEAKATFRQMKEHIAKLPMLTALEEQEELIVYLTASKEAVSVVLMTEREDRQMPIYFYMQAIRTRVSVKGQVLADFIIERPEEEGQDDFAKEEEPLPAQRLAVYRNNEVKLRRRYRKLGPKWEGPYEVTEALG